MATNFRELRKALATWARIVTEGRRKSEIANSGQKPQFRTPSIVTFLSEDRRLGLPRKQISEDGTEFTVTNTAQIRVQLDLYSGDPDNSSMEDAELLMSSLYDPNRYLDLWLICGLLSIETTRDLTSLETGVMKQRAQCVFNIIAQISKTHTTGSFNTVEVDVIRAEPEETVATLIVNADD